jgi:hypothetical protein
MQSAERRRGGTGRAERKRSPATAPRRMKKWRRAVRGR